MVVLTMSLEPAVKVIVSPSSSTKWTEWPLLGAKVMEPL